MYRNNSVKLVLYLVMTLVLTSSIFAQITLFNDSVSSIDLPYPQAFISHPFFIEMTDGVVAEAEMRIQGLDIFGQAILPADIMLVMDVSGSMNGGCPSPGCRIEDAITASISFLDNVNLNYIHVGHVHYSYWGAETATRLNTGLDIQLSDDRSNLETTISSMYAQGWTNMGGGMEHAMNELLSSRAQDPDRLYMLVLTDGNANCYPYDYNDYDLSDASTGNCDGDPIDETLGANFVTYIADLCAENNITIFGVAFGSDANQALVDDIAARTGGTSHFAPDAATLTSIYNQIAQTISYQDFPTPIISTTNPVTLAGWQYPSQFSLDVTWENADCGAGSALCLDFRDLLQQNIDMCTVFPCDVDFSVFSSTFGQLTLSDLYIEINEPPFSNFPPIGNCPGRSFACPVTMETVYLDDGSLVTDPNDDLDTLSWHYEWSIESSGGAYFIANNNYNTSRNFVVAADPAHLSENFWEVFVFNVSDPWGASTIACVNISYTGCTLCPNNFLDPGEECDDGNIFNNDSCVGSCQNATCGDGFVWTGLEECDNGAANNNVTPDACRLDCTNAACGDFVIDSGEACDDGPMGSLVCNPVCENSYCGDGFIQDPNSFGITEICDNGTMNNDTIGDACRTDCTLPFCGDSVTDNLGGEECDDGANGDDTDGCRDDCTFITCGNGFQEGIEECDDADADSSDACIIDPPYSCMNATCGDGYIWTVDCTSCEECDNGTSNSDSIPNACRSTCTDASCGDNTIDTGEDCDDGANGDNTDGCDDSCTYLTVCGNGIREGAEQCDDGLGNSDIIPDACRTNCQLSRCGDGIIDSADQCDDGNNNNGDGCSATCNNEVDPTADCGNNIVESGEDCDDGSSGSLECTPWCEWSSCGDDIIHRPNHYSQFEECDDGNSNPNDFCHNDCTYGTVLDIRTTIENITFNTIDLYRYVDDIWPPPEIPLIITNTNPGPLSLTWGFNSVRATPPDGWTGWYVINFTISDGFQQATLSVNFTVNPIPSYLISNQDTKLLVAKGQLVTGFYEDPLIGDITLWGPYIITVKVWER